MPMKTKRRRQKERQIQVPKQRAAPPQRQWWLYAGGAAGLAAIAAVLALTVFHGGGKSGREESAGLPDTPDYHSLLVNPSNSQKLVLGTHVGLYASSDGGRHWRFDALSGDDAMNLARPAGATLWLAGHQVFKKSMDGGTSSRDGGRSFSLASDQVGGNVTALAALPDGRILAGDMRQGLLESSDRGASW